MNTPTLSFRMRGAMIAVSMIAVLLLAGLGVVLAQDGEGICSVMVPTLNLRPNASTSGQPLYKINGSRDWLTVLGRNSSGNWLYVRVGSNGSVGWVNTGPNNNYLDCEVAISELPVTSGGAVALPPTPRPSPIPARALPTPTPISIAILGSGYQADEDDVTTGNFVMGGLAYEINDPDYYDPIAVVSNRFWIAFDLRTINNGVQIREVRVDGSPAELVNGRVCLTGWNGNDCAVIEVKPGALWPSGVPVRPGNTSRTVTFYYYNPNASSQSYTNEEDEYEWYFSIPEAYFTGNGQAPASTTTSGGQAPNQPVAASNSHYYRGSATVSCVPDGRVWFEGSVTYNGQPVNGAIIGFKSRLVEGTTPVVRPETSGPSDLRPQWPNGYHEATVDANASTAKDKHLEIWVLNSSGERISDYVNWDTDGNTGPCNKAVINFVSP